MSRQRVRYLNAKPAFGNAASDVALHNQLKGIIRGEHDQSDEGIEQFVWLCGLQTCANARGRLPQTRMGLDFPSIIDKDICASSGRLI